MSVHHHVQRVVHRYADDDGPDSDYYQRHRAAHHRHGCHSAQHAERHGQQDVAYLFGVAEGAEQEQQYQHHGQSDGDYAVCLYLSRIAHGYHGRAQQPYLHALLALHHLVADSVQRCYELRIAPCLRRSVRCGQIGERPSLVGGHHVSVGRAEMFRLGQVRPQPFHHGSEQVQRVGLYSACHKRRHGQQQLLSVGPQLAVDVAGLSEQAVHADIIRLGQKIRCVSVYPVYSVYVSLHIHLRRQLGQRRVRLVARLIRIHGVEQPRQVGRRVLKQHHDAVGVGKLLVALHCSLIFSVERQEVGNVFAEVQCQRCRHQRHAHHSEAPPQGESVAVQIVV